MASSGSADEADQDILIRGVYESGIVGYKRSRSLLSSKSKWFATACRTDAFMVMLESQYSDTLNDVLILGCVGGTDRYHHHSAHRELGT